VTPFLIFAIVMVVLLAYGCIGGAVHAYLLSRPLGHWADNAEDLWAALWPLAVVAGVLRWPVQISRRITGQVIERRAERRAEPVPKAQVVQR
jgi:hypothetical protein